MNSYAVDIPPMFLLDVYHKNLMFVFQNELYFFYFQIKKSKFSYKSKFIKKGIIKCSNKKIEIVKQLPLEYNYLLFSDRSEKYIVYITHNKKSKNICINVFMDDKIILKKYFDVEKNFDLFGQYFYFIHDYFEIYDLFNKKDYKLDLNKNNLKNENCHLLNNNLLLYNNINEQDLKNEKMIREIYEVIIK